MVMNTKEVRIPQTILNEMDGRNLWEELTDKIPLYGVIKRINRMDEIGLSAVERDFGQDWENGHYEDLRSSIRTRNLRIGEDVYPSHLFGAGVIVGTVLGAYFL